MPLPPRVFCDTSFFHAALVFRRRSRDHRLSLCDAVSFVVVTTLLDHMPCFAFDEDFRRLIIIATPH